jgi:hypothetical protein
VVHLQLETIFQQRLEHAFGLLAGNGAFTPCRLGFHVKVVRSDPLRRKTRLPGGPDVPPSFPDTFGLMEATSKLTY